MAINTSIIQFRGKVGNLVGGKDSKGRATVMAYQPTPNNPQTTKQVRQRVRFLTAVSLASGLKDHLAGLTHYAKTLRINRRNAFVKANLSGSYEATGGETARVIEANPVFGNMVATVAYEHLQLARGAQPCWRGGTPSVADADITATFGQLVVGDLLHMVAYNPADNRAVGVVTEVVSETQTVSVAWPSTWSGASVHVYAYSQTFADTMSRIEYLSYFNGHSVAAEADITTLEEASSYSSTVYLGSVTVG